MKIPDLINVGKIQFRKQQKLLSRSLWSNKKNFLYYGAEECFKSKIDSQRRVNVNHPINKKNIWDNGREYLAILQAEKEAYHFIKSHSPEEVQAFILKNIEQKNINVKDLSQIAQKYYHEILQKESTIIEGSEKIEEQLDTKASTPKKDKPLTKEDIIKARHLTLQEFDEGVALEFDAVYVKMPENRKRMEKQWTEELKEESNPFLKIHTQELLKKAHLFKARNLKTKKREPRDNDLEL